MYLLSVCVMSLKLLENFKIYNLLPRYTLTKIQWNFKSCDFWNSDVLPPYRLKPSIVATRKVNWCKFYNYFDQQSSLKTFTIKHN